MKLRTALYDGHTELATIDDLGAVTLGTPVFPTGNVGEIVFVDGSNHAATSADLTFDDGSKTLTVNGGTVSAPRHVAASTAELDFVMDGTGNVFTAFIGWLAPGAQTVPETMIMGISGNSVGNITQIQSGQAVWGLDDAAGANPQAFYPQADNAQDLGSPTNRVRTGYFGTSVSAPLFVAAGTGNGITTTVTTASLVGKTITITGGIITGFA